MAEPEDDAPSRILHEPLAPGAAASTVTGGLPPLPLVRVERPRPPPFFPAPGADPRDGRVPDAIARAHALPPPPADATPVGLSPIGPVHERKSRDWALVLQSMGIWHVRRYAGVGWVLLVHDADRRRAEQSIDRYEHENRDWPPPEARERPRFPISPAATLAFLALVVFFAVTGPVAGGSQWFARGVSVSDLVVQSEPWRAVTALTLHADSGHVLGNAISGSIFGTAVQRRLGAGGGSLAIVASGIAGNAANALYYHAMGEPHGSLGASTAVFGAIGILAATQLVVDRGARRHSRGWLAVVTPVAGGLALLGALGASPSADLNAHLFGFASGLVIGLGFGRPFRLAASAAGAEHSPPVLTRGWAQAVLGTMALGVLVVSWMLAMKVV